MAPLDHAIQIQGDITLQKTADDIIGRFDGRKAQLVVCDGAPDVLGLHDWDEYVQAQLVLAALHISLNVLEAGGTFVAKIFRGKEVSRLYMQLARFFPTIICAKPKASRNSSLESFVVCKGLSLPYHFVLPSMDTHGLFDVPSDEERVRGSNTSFIVGFQSCGDVLHGWDPDQSYPVDNSPRYDLQDNRDNVVTYVHQAPLQVPIKPPYALAKERLAAKAVKTKQ